MINSQNKNENRLLQVPDKRLGKGGSRELFSHPFFAGVAWDKLLDQKPPFVPRLPKGPLDLSYFPSAVMMSDKKFPENASTDDLYNEVNSADMSDDPESSIIKKRRSRSLVPFFNDFTYNHLR